VRIFIGNVVCSGIFVASVDCELMVLVLVAIDYAVAVAVAVAVVISSSTRRRENGVGISRGVDPPEVAGSYAPSRGVVASGTADVPAPSAPALLVAMPTRSFDAALVDEAGEREEEEEFDDYGCHGDGNNII